MDIKIDTSKDNPVILIDSEPVTPAQGIQAILKFKNWSRVDMAHYLKVSNRTIDGWVSGRTPGKPIMIALSYMLI